MRPRIVAAALICALWLPSHAQDFGREARWRSEVASGLVVGEAVDLRSSDGRAFLGLYTHSVGAKTALVIVHGIGVHPDHGLIGTLRMALADRGFSTLSIQMPVLAAEARPDEYARLFPLAAERIGIASAWLSARGYRDSVLISHSMGSRMANAYFDTADQPVFRAWIALGLGTEFSRPFEQRRPLPVLDVLGDADLPAVLNTAAERRRVTGLITGSRQLTIKGADHFYAGRHAALIEAIAAFAAH